MLQWPSRRRNSPGACPHIPASIIRHSQTQGTIFGHLLDPASLGLWTTTLGVALCLASVIFTHLVIIQLIGLIRKQRCWAGYLSTHTSFSLNMRVLSSHPDLESHVLTGCCPPRAPGRTPLTAIHLLHLPKRHVVGTCQFPNRVIALD